MRVVVDTECLHQRGAKGKIATGYGRSYRGESGILLTSPITERELFSCTVGEGGERSEAGQGLAAVTHKIDQFSLHTAAR
jgi:hypothetical protein